MCDSDGRWSTETVELVARAWYQSETPHYPLPGTLSSTGRRYRAQARMVLAALADAGLLMPPVGQPEPEPGGRGAAVPVDDGTDRAVAHANGVGCDGWSRQRHELRRWTEPADSGDSLADTEGARRRTGRAGRSAGGGADGEEFAASGLANSHGPRRGPWEGVGGSWPAPVRSGWWAAEPDVGRVAPRAAYGVDRLRALGNAVVPQVAEHIGRMILASVMP